MTNITEIFLDIHHSLIHIVSKIAPHSEAEDIVQDVFLKSYMAEENGHIRQPKAFMIKVAKNLAFDYIKSAHLKTTEYSGDNFVEFIDSLNKDSHIDMTYNHVMHTAEILYLYEKSKSLPERCREAYFLKKAFGFSQKEISTKLRISESLVEKYLSQGRQHIYKIANGLI